VARHDRAAPGIEARDSTPGEFAEAAIEAGLDEDDVGQPTQLFEEVRYGKRDPESREERAIEVFRAIEAAYGRATTPARDEGVNNERRRDAEAADRGIGLLFVVVGVALIAVPDPFPFGAEVIFLAGIAAPPRRSRSAGVSRAR